VLDALRYVSTEKTLEPQYLRTSEPLIKIDFVPLYLSTYAPLKKCLEK